MHDQRLRFNTNSIDWMTRAQTEKSNKIYQNKELYFCHIFSKKKTKKNDSIQNRDYNALRQLNFSQIAIAHCLNEQNHSRLCFVQYCVCPRKTPWKTIWVCGFNVFCIYRKTMDHKYLIYLSAQWGIFLPSKWFAFEFGNFFHNLIFDHFGHTCLGRCLKAKSPKEIP